VSRILLGFATTLGLVLMGIVAAVHYFGAFWLTADDHVRQLVRSVTLQSMLCELLCAVVVVIEGIAIASSASFYQCIPKENHLRASKILENALMLSTFKV
jgi:hypothetical protein